MAPGATSPSAAPTRPNAWIDVIGVGLEGVAALSAEARAALERAEVLVGAERHFALAAPLAPAAAERLAWPSPFSAMLQTLEALKDRRVVVLVTGDPLWYSAGAKIARGLPGAARFHPALAAFQRGAARLGWSLADVETLTIHGRPLAAAVPYFAPDARLLALPTDAGSPQALAARLVAEGYGGSRMTALSEMDGPGERRAAGAAREWASLPPEGVSDFHLLAAECRLDPGRVPLPRTGLPDDAFAHDGKLTKREVRAVTLAALAPRRGALLWDIGLGCGSVAIEWMRAARDARAIGLEPNAERRAMAAENAERLGAPRLDIRAGRAPEALADWPAPDAVFLGGGISETAAEAALERLRPGGRLAANAVTLESAAVLTALQARHGGSLSQIAVSRAEPVGPWRGWRPLMPVTQWVVAR